MTLFKEHLKVPSCHLKFEFGLKMILLHVFKVLRGFLWLHRPAIVVCRYSNHFVNQFDFLYDDLLAVLITYLLKLKEIRNNRAMAHSSNRDSLNVAEISSTT